MQTQGNEVDYVCDKRGFFTGGKISQRHLIKQCIFFCFDRGFVVQTKKYVEVSCTNVYASDNVTCFYHLLLAFQDDFKGGTTKVFSCEIKGKMFSLGNGFRKFK